MPKSPNPHSHKAWVRKHQPSYWSVWFGRSKKKDESSNNGRQLRDGSSVQSNDGSHYGSGRGGGSYTRGSYVCVVRVCGREANSFRERGIDTDNDNGVRSGDFPNVGEDVHRAAERQAGPDGAETETHPWFPRTKRYAGEKTRRR
jgi:hypothetical protein